MRSCFRSMYHILELLFFSRVTVVNCPCNFPWNCPISHFIKIFSTMLISTGPPLNPQVVCDKKSDASLSRAFMFYWRSPKYNGGAPVFLYTVKHRSFVSALERNTQKWNSINVTHKRTWYRFKLEWQRTFEFTITAWNIYGESALDVDNTCLITVGKGKTIAP